MYDIVVVVGDGDIKKAVKVFFQVKIEERNKAKKEKKEAK